MKKFAILFALAFVPSLSWFCDPAAANEAAAGPITAPALSGIQIDGDLSDWPADLDTHYLELTLDGDSLAKEDLDAHFRIGYSPEQQLLYLAIEVQDDTLALAGAGGQAIDAAELYIDGDHSGGRMELPEIEGFAQQLTFLQYRGYAGEGSYDGDYATNPFVCNADLSQTRTQMAHSIDDDKITYEWAIQPFDDYPRQPTALLPGKTIGFDLIIIDRDSEADDAKARRLMWMPRETFDWQSGDQLGDVILGETDYVAGAPSATATVDLTAIALPEILEQTAAAYAALQTYADSLHITIDADSAIASSQRLSWNREGILRFEGRKDSDPLGALHSDGDSLIQYSGYYNRYTVKEQPAPFGINHTSELNLPGLRIGHQLAMSSDPRSKFAHGLVSAKVIDNDAPEGTTVVALVQQPTPGNLVSGMISGEPLTIELWIDAETHLVRRASYEAPLDKMPREWVYNDLGQQGRFTEQYITAQTDPTLSDDHFAFTAPQGADRVDWFGSEKPWIGRRAPDFALTDYDGNEIALADYRGKVLIVDFWGTWCPPCVKEMPSFVELHQKHRDQGFEIIAIACYDKERAVRKFNAKHNIEFATPPLDADKQVQRDYKVGGFPTSFVLDKQGIIRYAHVGLPADEKVFTQYIEELLAEDGTAMLDANTDH